jgi:hypothetical protein
MRQSRSSLPVSAPLRYGENKEFETDALTGTAQLPYASSPLEKLIDKMYPFGYGAAMTEIRKTEYFAKWIDGLQDIRARARIQARIERLAMGNPGDIKPVVKEFRRCVLIMVPVIGFITYSMSDW